MGGAAAVSPLLTTSSASVPFGLLAAVQLLAATAFLSLGVAGIWPRLRGRGAWLLLGASMVLATPEILTGCRFGNSSGTLLSALRCAGAVLLGAALYQGALRPGPDRSDDPDTDRGGSGSAGILHRLGPATGGAAVVSPLGASVPVAWLAAAAFVGAAVMARSRPPRLRIPLMSGLVLCAAAELLTPAARSSSSADTQVLLLRGLGAICLLAVLVALARATVLGRVATVIFSAVLLTAIGSVAVAGTVATSTLEREQSDTARRLHRQAQTELDGQVRRTETTARQAATCPGGPAGCPNLVSRTSTLVELEGGTARHVAGANDAAVLSDLPRIPFVASALHSRGSEAERSVSGLAVVAGRPDRLVIVAVSGADEAGRRAAVVIPIDLHRLTSARNADLAVVLLPSGQVVSSTFPPTYQERLIGLLVGNAQQVTRSDSSEPAVVAGLRGRGRAAAAPLGPVVGVPTTGETPTAVLSAASRDDGLVKTQRRVLAGLFLALAATAVLVGLLGVLLGAGVVRPIRRVTEAARRVRAGEQATAGPGGSDELGELARAFDAMTTSLTGAQEKLRRTAEREATTRAHLSVVLDSLGDGLLVVDDDEQVTDSNSAARSLLGGDPVGRDLAEVLPDGADVVVETGGSSHYLSVRRSPLAEGGGTVVLLRDRTREREAERMKTEFLANVSHELRTPLTPVRGYAELLRRRRDAGPDEVAEHAGVIASAANRMSRVVDLLVDVAALDAGRVSPSVAPMPLLPFLSERVSVWRDRRPDRADDLSAPASARLPAVLADGRWLAKALDELIDNALKYTPAGTPVTVEAIRLDGRMRVGVRDSGPGLDDAARAALYDDFAQADGSVTRAKDGLGLGLPFVRRVAALFEFDLAVESRPGEGAFFGLDVPLAPRPLPQRPPAAAETGGNGAGSRPHRPRVERPSSRSVPPPAEPTSHDAEPKSRSGRGSGTSFS